MSKALELSQLANNLTITEGTDTVTLGQANVVLSGNLQVDGTSTTLNTSTLTVDDLNITIADGAADAASANGAGLTVDGASATLLYGSTNDNWSFNKRLDVTGDVVITSNGVNGSGCLQINNTDSSNTFPKAIEAYQANIAVGARNQIMLGKDGSPYDTATLQFYYAGDASTSNRFEIGFWSADSLLNVIANGNVGIGTTDPGTLLDVRGDVTAKTSDGAILKLQTSDTTVVDGNVLGAIEFSAPDEASGGDAITTAASIVAEADSTYSAGSNAADIVFIADTTEIMRVEHNGNMIVPGGNVGIGTNAPEYPTHIEGTNVSSGGGLATLCVNDTGTAYNGTDPGGGITFRGVFNSSSSTTNFATVQGIKENATDGNYDTALRFTTRADQGNLTEKMRIDHDGNVGIGTTDPGDKLVVYGDGARMTVNSVDHEVAMLGRRGSSGVDLDRGYLRLRKDGVTNDGVVIDTGGNSWFNGGDVGIGTTTPAANLHLHGDGDMIRLTSTNAGTGGSQIDLLHFSPSTANEDIMAFINMGGYYSGTTSAYFSSIRTIATDAGSRHGRIEFLTVDDSTLSTKMTIDHLGNVGIGTTQPEAELHIKNSTDPRIRIESTSTSSTPVPGLEFYSRGKDASNEDLGIITWHGNDAGSNLTRYCYLFGEIQDISSNSEDGRLFMTTISGGNENAVYYEMRGQGSTDDPLTAQHQIRGNSGGHILHVRRDVLDQPNYGAVVAISLGENTGPEDDPWIDFYNYGSTGSGGESTSNLNGSIGTINGNQGTHLWGYETLMLRATTDADFPALNSNAGIGLTINSTSSTFYGDLDVTGDVTAYSSSDQRLKTDLQPIENSLDKVKSLTGYTFNWNELAENKPQDQREAGVLAQDVEAVLPEVTTTKDDGYKSVRYEKMVPLLVEAIKELSDKVDAQQQEIERLRKWQ